MNVVYFDVLAAVFFLISSVYLCILYCKERDTSAGLLLYGSVIAFLWAIMVTLEWSGIYTQQLDTYQQPLIGFVVFAIFYGLSLES